SSPKALEGRMRASMQVTTATLRAGGMGSPPLSKLLAYSLLASMNSSMTGMRDLRRECAGTTGARVGQTESPDRPAEASAAERAWWTRPKRAHCGPGQPSRGTDRCSKAPRTSARCLRPVNIGVNGGYHRLRDCPEEGWPVRSLVAKA